MFRARSGIARNGWVEAVEVCMRARHLTVPGQAFFLFDHLGGDACEEIKYHPFVQWGDPDRVIARLMDVYGCSKCYVTLQEAFVS